jgi:glutamyl-tRNA reductase
VNLLVVGVSHHSAPVELLERLAVPREQTPQVLDQLMASPYLGEAVVVSTCNRVEVYAAVSAFHGGLADIGAVLAQRAGTPIATLTPHLKVHYEDDAVAHALRVAAGLDSMVVGEAQILGQFREAYQVAAEHETVGRLLHELMQQALRVGKRVHTETGIDRAGQSVVSAALDLVPRPVAGRGALVVGAGSMGALALATLARAGAAPLLVANRGTARASRAAAEHGAVAVDLDDLPQRLTEADLVVCATASPHPVLTRDIVAAALPARGDRPLVLVDLAVPRDVDPEVATLPGVTVVDLDSIASARLDAPSVVDREAGEAIVAAEVAAFRAWQRGAEAVPTVAALRARADEVVGAELRRLWQRRPDLTEEQRADLAQTVHRVVAQLLHQPTVRVRQLASTPGGERYAAVLRELFDLSVPDLTAEAGGSLGRAVDVRPSTVDPSASAVDGAA